jgi:hypothetical protein
MPLIDAVRAKMRTKKIPSILQLSAALKLSYGHCYSVINGWHRPNSRTLPTWSRFLNCSAAKLAGLVEAEAWNGKPSPKGKRKSTKRKHSKALLKRAEAAVLPPDVLADIEHGRY